MSNTSNDLIIVMTKGIYDEISSVESNVVRDSEQTQPLGAWVDDLIEELAIVHIHCVRDLPSLAPLFPSLDRMFGQQCDFIQRNCAFDAEEDD